MKLDKDVFPRVAQRYGHVELILLYDDVFAEQHLKDRTMGFLACNTCYALEPFLFTLPRKEQDFCPRCKHSTGEGLGCTTEGHADGRYKVLPDGGVSREAEMLRHAFISQHHHGDGMMLLMS